jgi:hypothetical protein
MSVWQFRLLVAGEMAELGVDVLFDRADDACVEVLPAGLADLAGLAGLAGAGGVGPGPVAWVAFDREAPTLVDAVVSGVRDLDVAGIVASSAAADDPIVTLETIAERVGRPVEVVRAWDLPAPVGPHPRRPAYAWPEVSAWLRRHRAYAPPDEAVTLHAVTLTLQLRALAPRLERMAPIRSLLHL